MTETTCPTCGAKCNTTKKPQYKNSEYVDYFALPPPDLTKLRGTWNRIKNSETRFIKSHHIVDIGDRHDLWQAIKELLEENK